MRLCYYPIKGLQMVQGYLLLRHEEGNLLYHNFTLRKYGWKMYLFNV